MTGIIQTWTEQLRHNWGLADFVLKSADIRREATLIDTTEYILDMEWFPPGAEMVDDLNPSGTVVVKVNCTHGFVTSFIVVQSEERRENPPKLSGITLHYIVEWIEKQTGLMYNIDFQLRRQEKKNNYTEYFFRSILQDKKVSPGGYIEVKVNQAGTIVFYSLSGFFPSLNKEISIHPEPLQPIQQLDTVKENQIVLFGVMEESGYRLLYGVEETFIELEREEFVLHWNKEDKVIDVMDTGQEIWKRWEEFIHSQTISEADIIKNIPHPDTIPIPSDVKRELVEAITHYMHAHRPEESGQWKMEHIERQRGLLSVDVIPIKMTDRFMDKFKFLYDTDAKKIIQALDKRSMFNEMMEIPSLDVNISLQEAANILRKDIFIEPFFVYDHHRHQLRIMHWIDCHVFVDAQTGETERG